MLLDVARKKDGDRANESGNFLFEALGASALLARCEDGRALSSVYSVLASRRAGKTGAFKGRAQGAHPSGRTSPALGAMRISSFPRAE